MCGTSTTLGLLELLGSPLKPASALTELEFATWLL